MHTLVATALVAFVIPGNDPFTPLWSIYGLTGLSQGFPDELLVYGHTAASQLNLSAYFDSSVPNLFFQSLLYNPSTLELEVMNLSLFWLTLPPPILTVVPFIKCRVVFMPDVEEWYLPERSMTASPVGILFQRSWDCLDVSWEIWGLGALRWCSGFFCDLLDESLWHSWWTVAPFSPFVDNGNGSLESKCIGNGFITCSRLTDFKGRCLFSHPISI